MLNTLAYIIPLATHVLGHYAQGSLMQFLCDLFVSLKSQFEKILEQAFSIDLI